MGRTWRKEEREKNRKHGKEFKEARKQRQNKRRIGEDETEYEKSVDWDKKFRWEN